MGTAEHLSPFQTAPPWLPFEELKYEHKITAIVVARAAAFGYTSTLVDEFRAMDAQLEATRAAEREHRTSVVVVGAA